MEKIIQFHAGIKIPTATRHTTSPAYFSAQSGLSDPEEVKENPEDLSPVYKKKSHFSDKMEKNDKKDFKVLQFSNKYDTDSEPNSPESTIKT